MVSVNMEVKERCKNWRLLLYNVNKKSENAVFGGMSQGFGYLLLSQSQLMDSSEHRLEQ